MPGRTVDNGVPANADNRNPVGCGCVDLIQYVSQPGPLMQAGMPPMVDRMPIMPACLGYHYGLAVPTPCFHQDFCQGRPSRMRIIVYTHHIDVNSRHYGVGGLELSLTHSGDGIIGHDANVRVMITGHTGHRHRHLDCFALGHFRDCWIKRWLVDRTEPKPLRTIDGKCFFGGKPCTADRVLVSVIMGQVPYRFDARVPCGQKPLGYVVTGNEAVAHRCHAMTADNAVMLSHPRLSGMLGRHQQIMTTAVDETTFKPGKDLAYKERLGLKWKSVLQLILTSVMARSVTPPCHAQTHLVTRHEFAHGRSTLLSPP